MMKRSLRAAPALAAFLLLAGIAHANADRTLAVARERALARAIASRNLAAIGRLLAPDFVALDPKGGKWTRAQFIDSFKTLFAASTSATIRDDVVKTVRRGHTLDVTTNSRSVVAIKTPGGHDRRFVQTSKKVDSWRKGRSGWLLVRERVTSSSSTLDGRKMPAR